jgi:streptogramin lyase
MPPSKRRPTTRARHRTPLLALALALLVLVPLGGRAQSISTVAGGGSVDGSPALAIGLGGPASFAVDAAGNVYVAAQSAHRIFRIAPSGAIYVAAGSGSLGYVGDGGPATAAGLAAPSGVAVDAAGNLYIADTDNHLIRRVDGATGTITTLTGNLTPDFSGDGGPAALAAIASPTGVALDAAGNLFIADSENHRIRRISAATGTISTVAGTGIPGFTGDGGPATAARLRRPTGVALDAAGNLLIADSQNNRIRRVSASTGTISTIAGRSSTPGFSGDGGLATNARLANPVAIALDGAENLFIADQDNDRIRRVSVATATITSVAGNGTFGFSGDGGPATSAQLAGPLGVAVDTDGNLLIADRFNQRIRRVSPAGTIETSGGNGSAGFFGDGGPATSATLARPSDVALDAAGNLFIADRDNQRVRRVDAVTGAITTVAGNGTFGSDGDGGPATSASIATAFSVAVDAAGNLFISDYQGYRVRRVNAATGVIDTVAGTGQFGFSGDGGPATSAAISSPARIAFDAAGNLFIPDEFNHRIRRVDGVTGTITTVAGNGIDGFSGDGGPATLASLNLPVAVAVDAAGNLYVADQFNDRIRRVDGVTGTITTVAGNGSRGGAGDGGPATAAELAAPAGVAVDADGNVYIADQNNQRIRRVDVATGIITTVVGNGVQTFSGDGGAATLASLDGPVGIEFDANGSLFIADRDNQRIRFVGSACLGMDCSAYDTACSVAWCDPAGAPGNCDMTTLRPSGAACLNGVCPGLCNGVSATCVAPSPSVDVDGDGVPDCIDNCPTVPNTDQANEDGDSAGDACDAFIFDPTETLDSDGDGIGDNADGCPFDPDKASAGACGCGVAETDTDGDGTPNCIDLCAADPAKTAPGQCGCGVVDSDGDGDGTADCNDLCASDPAKTAPGACGCGVADTDTDGDGTPNCNDLCASDPAKTAPGVCGCGVVESTADADGDGTPDCVDQCAADPAKTLPGVCGCGVADTDTDGDGTADCNDLCANDSAKTQPGLCGCGVADTDTDGDGTADCNDLCASDPAKTAPGVCGCGVVESTADADGDGTPDCVDQCAADPAKTLPGVCGCGVVDTDSDGDGTADCNDLCASDPAKTAPGQCGCGIADTDGDGDGTPNCNDLCASDPAKTAPGVCGCGVVESTADADGDGTPDCVDQCAADPAKTLPGVCGCGVADTDGDGDGTPNCNDLCATDPTKTSPGQCGCGVADSDGDGDGTADCNDLCASDPAKTAPGQCGCGALDTDGDGDGTADCNDLCATDPAKLQPGVCGCGVAETDTDGDATPNCVDLDDDGDGLLDSEEVILGTNPLLADTDADGLGDRVELLTGVLNPLNPNTDGDVALDGADNCPSVNNDQSDTDADGVGQACDTCPATPNPPVPAVSVQPWMTLVSGQRDDDGDGLGNRCDFDHDQQGLVITTSDFNLMKASVGQLVSTSSCGGASNQVCGKFDQDEAGSIITTTDFNLLKARIGSLRPPSCGTACTRPFNLFGKALCSGPGC